MSLLAVESDDGRMAVIAFLASAISGAAVWGSSQIWKLYDERKKRSDGAEKSVNEYLQELVKRLDREREEKGRDNDALTKRVSRLAIRTTALLSHVRYLERILQINKLSFERYEEPADPDDSDTKTHAPVTDAIRQDEV